MAERMPDWLAKQLLEGGPTTDAQLAIEGRNRLL
jgi:hypothetical protein